MISLWAVALVVITHGDAITTSFALTLIVFDAVRTRHSFEFQLTDAQWASAAREKIRLMTDSQARAMRKITARSGIAGIVLLILLLASSAIHGPLVDRIQGILNMVLSSLIVVFVSQYGASLVVSLTNQDAYSLSSHKLEPFAELLVLMVLPKSAREPAMLAVLVMTCLAFIAIHAFILVELYRQDMTFSATGAAILALSYLIFAMSVWGIVIFIFLYRGCRLARAIGTAPAA
jgi:hypothetical protein